MDTLGTFTVNASSVTFAVRRSSRTYSVGNYYAPATLVISRQGGVARVGFELRDRSGGGELSLDKDAARDVILALRAVFPSLTV